jgi:hypothetical protein
MDSAIPDELAVISPLLRGLACWYVNSGGAAGPTFQLALGGKRPRSVPLTNCAHPEAFRNFEGEAGLYVWCAWRLDGPDRPVTSWDDSDASIEAGLVQLIGNKIEAVEISPPAWELTVRWSNSLCLRVFCDHVPGDPSFDGNWDVQTQSFSIEVGPGVQFRVDRRD